MNGQMLILPSNVIKPAALYLGLNADSGVHEDKSMHILPCAILLIKQIEFRGHKREKGILSDTEPYNLCSPGF